MLSSFIRDYTNYWSLNYIGIFPIVCQHTSCFNKSTDYLTLTFIEWHAGQRRFFPIPMNTFSQSFHTYSHISASPEISTSNITYIALLYLHYIFSNMSFPTPHCGHTQSTGRSSKAVPGFIRGVSPISGS
jgi:hypothetical protein